MKRLLILGSVLAATAATGCIPPRVLVSEELVGPRTVKYALQRNDHLYNFSARVCDVDDHGDEINCSDTMLLTDVVYRPTPHSF